MSYRAEISEMLRKMPPDWHRQYRVGRATLARNGGPVLPDTPTPEQAMLILGNTAGGNFDTDKPTGDQPVPKAVRDAAMKGLRLSYRNNYGGWEFFGIARAIQLALVPKVPMRTRERMVRYLEAHEKDKAGSNFGNDAKPSRGYMAWLNWGGDPAVAWNDRDGIERATYGAAKRRNGVKTTAVEAAAKVGAKLGIKSGGKLLPVVGEALMAYDVTQEGRRIYRERKEGKKHSLRETGARLAGSALVGSEGVAWAQKKLEVRKAKKNPSEDITDRYGHGECHVLTTALAQTIPAGKPYLVEFDPYWTGEASRIIHSLFKTPDGRWVDAYGPETLTKKMHRWFFLVPEGKNPKLAFSLLPATAKDLRNLTGAKDLKRRVKEAADVLPEVLQQRSNPRYTSAVRTDPELWEEVKAEVTRGPRGGLPGQWSARKAQMAVALYQDRGGGYVGPKSPRNALAKWTREQWRTKSGRPSLETGERYLPAAAIAALTPAEYAATSRVKRAGMRKGEQFVPQPERIAEKVKRYRRNPEQPTSAAFRAWFGDSKVPGVMYHGTGSDFSVFSETGASSLRPLGFWFADSPDDADAFGDRILPAWLRVERPYVIDYDNLDVLREKAFKDKGWAKSFRERLIQKGHDGVLVLPRLVTLGRFTLRDAMQVVVFSPTQIKSAYGNRGTFDLEDPDIRHNRGARA